MHLLESAAEPRAFFRTTQKTTGGFRRKSSGRLREPRFVRDFVQVSSRKSINTSVKPHGLIRCPICKELGEIVELKPHGSGWLFLLGIICINKHRFAGLLKLKRVI
jgi:hypothetical protein